MAAGKRPQNIVDEIVQGIEQGLTEFLGWAGKEIWKLIKKIFNLNRNSGTSLDISLLDVKEDWGHPDAFGYSLRIKSDIGLGPVDLNRHTVVCGTTGSGKNVTLDNLVENRLKAGLPVVMIDPKGDNKALLKFKKLNAHYNRKCYIFSESYPLSDSCNPILEGEASTIVNRLFSIFDWGEPYYADTNYVALEKAVYALKSNNVPVTISALLNYLETNLKDKETQNIINKLSKIDKSAFGEILSAKEDSITFSKIRADRASIYIGLSTLGFPEVSQAIGKLFVYELMYHSYKTFSEFIDPDFKLPPPFMVVIDELGSVITEDFISLINKCRGAGIGVCVSFQLLSDLDCISDQFRDQLIGNMNNFFIGHTHVPTEAEYWSKMLGTSQGRKFTHQTEDDEDQSKGSVREVEEFLVHPSIFKKLKIGQFVIKSFLPNNYLDVVKVHMRIDKSFMKRIDKKLEGHLTQDRKTEKLRRPERQVWED
jgi:hypothetical protein